MKAKTVSEDLIYRMSFALVRRLLRSNPGQHVIVIALMALIILPGNLPVIAAPLHSVQIYQVTQQDLDQDGMPDLTIIDCSFVTQSDRVLVYRQAGAMPSGTDWQQVTNFEHHTWIFDVGADGSAQLIIEFSRQEDRVTAALFDDQDNDGSVAYEVRGREVFVREPPLRPPLTVTADGAWLRSDGNLNWNLRFQTDGASVQIISHIPDHIQSALSFNSEPDLEMEFRDTDNDGIPDYGLMRLLASSRLDEGFPRTQLWVNSGRHRPAPPGDFVFWPLLSGSFTGNNFFDGPPIIEVDWATARILRAYLPGYPIEHGYYINTLQYFYKDEINYADFENPMAYYDLANDQDGLPELHVRIVHQRAGDPYRDNLPVPVNTIRWSWNQTNAEALIWDYKLGLAGRHTITSTVTFPDFASVTIPYDELPGWITSRNWDYATFVAREGARDLSSEGIYQWGATDTLGAAGVEYLAGRAILNINAAFQDLPVGWRGDVAPDLGAQPFVYFSPVDRKLHLRDAHHGVWKTDGASELRYANLNGDAYLDQWTYTQVVKGSQPFTFTKQLNVARSHLLYSDGSEVIIRQAQVAPSLFETLPPIDHEQWQVLGARIEAEQRDLLPDDFLAMMQQFDGPEMRITGASLRDYRPLGEQGFRFVLTLHSNFQVQDSDLLRVAALDPGHYAVTYDGDFRIEPLTLPTLSASVVSAALTRLQQGTVQVQLRNDGLQDLPAATFELWATPPQGQETLAVTQTVALLAQVPITSTLHWAPPTAGQWTLTSKVRYTDGLLITLDSEQITVSPAPTADPEVMVTTSTSSQTLLFALLGLIVLATIAAITFGRQWRSLPADQVDDAA